MCRNLEYGYYTFQEPAAGQLGSLASDQVKNGFVKGKVSVTSLERPIRPALISGFCSMRRLGVLLLPPGWDASLSQGYPQHFHWYPFIHLGRGRHCEIKVSSLRTQHNVPTQDLNPDHLIQSQAL